MSIFLRSLIWGKKRKSVVGEQLFGGSVSGERVCVLDVFVEVGAG